MAIEMQLKHVFTKLNALVDIVKSLAEDVNQLKERDTNKLPQAVEVMIKNLHMANTCIMNKQDRLTELVQPPKNIQLAVWPLKTRQEIDDVITQMKNIEYKTELVRTH